MQKIFALAVLIALCIGLIYLAYYFIHYIWYDGYTKYLTENTTEEGKTYSPIKETKPDVEGMELAAENDTLKLYVNTVTGEAAVYDKRDATVVRTNPTDADADTIANETNKNYMKSQFVLNYYNANVVPGIYDSYSMCVAKEQLLVEGLDNGVRFVYDLGDYEGVTTGIVPIYITSEKLEELAGKLEENDSKSLLRYYIPSDVGGGMLQLNGVAQRNTKTLQKIAGWLETIGWTEEDLVEQQEMAGVESSMPLSFTVALEYRLVGDALEVSVPTSLIEERGGGSIYQIQLLQFMGAAGTAEDGYMVVPNGSGSLIHFNNGKTGVANYSQYVYGIDPLLANYTTIEETQDAKLPLYGICREDSAILTTIEGGSSLAGITAGISGVYHSYNYAYPTFVLRGADNLLMFGASAMDVFVVEKDLIDVNMRVRYTMLTQDYRGYSGIAAYYRERLTKEGALTAKTEAGDIPMYLDVIGGVKETKHVLGAQYMSNFPMTTFEQAGEIYQELAATGISRQVMNYQGWFNGGYYHNTPEKVRITGKLGGKSGLEDLSSLVTDNGGRFYADVAFQKVSWEAEEHGYNYEAENSRYYGTGFSAAFAQTNPTNLRNTSPLGYPETGYNVLSPKFLPRHVGGFAKKIEKVDIEGISLRDLGSYLASDKRRTEVISREQALEIVDAQLARLMDTGKDLMINQANSYSFRYARDILNAPVKDNSFFLVDEDIPLYEMILHGYIDYSGQLLNFTDTLVRQTDILNMIEYGAAPHYVFTWEDSSLMKNTGLSRFYATTFSVWKEDAVSTYQAVNEALRQVNGAIMTGHDILDNGVRKISYSNGVTLYVNYSETEQAAEGVTIPPLYWISVVQ
jgi:hypothetical protein